MEKRFFYIINKNIYLCIENSTHQPCKFNFNWTEWKKFILSVDGNRSSTRLEPEPARHGPESHGTARHGLERHGLERHGPERHGSDRHGQAAQLLKVHRFKEFQRGQSIHILELSARAG